MGTWGALVGRKCRGYSFKHSKVVVCLLESYDPSHGFWAVNVDDPTDRHDLSERAIDRTWHLVREELPR